MQVEWYGCPTPTELELTWPGGSLELKLEDGRATFSPIRTDQLRISVEAAENVFDLDFDAQSLPVGIGISELRLDGSTHVPLGVCLGCARRRPLRQRARRDDQSHGVQHRRRCLGPGAVPGHTGAGNAVRRNRAPGAAEGAGTLSLPAGENRVSVRSTRAFQPASLVLLPQGASLPPPASVARLAAVSGSVVARRLQPTGVPAGEAPGVIELRQNASAGWQASQGGRRLAPLVLDGWKQGWVLTGNGPVTARFAPDGLYRIGLIVGLALFAVLVGLVVLFLRRERITAGPMPLAGRGLPFWGACLALALGADDGGLGRCSGRRPDGSGGHRCAAQVGPLMTWVLAAPCLSLRSPMP